ncbi:hypothetical protein KDA_41550 [Dictyobacter alpinus]|uniref:Uncharacterized protein n=2 Tax=Dictyobacter alpinus TaxID=2014873 RepID=A0A402BB62_9CHLR|nr:hypothetical protein KDA_41550 [Dictyobacter alpinus]
MPLLAYAGGIVLIAIVLVACYFLGGGDWAAQAARVGIVALIIGIILPIVWFIRTRSRLAVSAGMPRRIISIVCIVALLAASPIANAMQGSLHMQEGRYFEDRGQWQAAIDEYTAAGEKKPGSVALARTYTSWGLALNKAKLYTQAINQFTTVSTDYPGIDDQVIQAHQGEVTARIALGKQASQLGNYNEAIKNFDTTLKLQYCYAACQSEVKGVDSTAYYNLGESQFKEKNYDDTVTSFDKILTDFAGTPEAAKLHKHMATSLLNVGKDQRRSSCSSAVPTYQRLGKDFSDTPEGKNAQNELKQPQNVTGHFVNNEPNRNYTRMSLVQGLMGNMTTDQMFALWDGTQLKTDIQANGNFTFTAVPQDNYDLLWYQNSGGTERVAFRYNTLTNIPTHTAKVGPLCPVDVGDVKAGG